MTNSYKGSPEIFGIGLSRTGTTSLHKALKMLGYSSLHFPFLNDWMAYLGILKLKNQYKNYQAILDTPVALKYKQLDQKFPNSKFILTIRDQEDWLGSVSRYKHFQDKNKIPRALQLLHKRLYGSACYQKDLYKEAFIRHNCEVRNYFRDRPNDLLVMDIISGDGWEKLCEFLNCPIPDQAFPHINKGENRNV